jgi:hypothetical protein
MNGSACTQRKKLAIPKDQKRTVPILLKRHEKT